MKQVPLIILVTGIVVTIAVVLSLRARQRVVASAPPGLSALPPIRHSDRILILAPHEDDESLGCGGLIQQAVAVGAQVRVLYLTNGDHNQLAFLLYRKSPWISPKVNRSMGEVRRRESTEAMQYLGVSAEQLEFLGFPDNDTLGIWTKHWGAAPPLHSILTNTTAVPYRGSPLYGKPYKGEEIVAGVERALKVFNPTRVFVPHPIDGNPDHRAFYLFLQVALLNSGRNLHSPTVLTYPIHMGPWPRPHRYHPTEWLPFPKCLRGSEKESFTLELTPDQVQRKYEAIGIYRSQMSDSAYWLTAFARRNELYVPVAPLNLYPHSQWSAPAEAIATSETRAYEEEGHEGHVKEIAYLNSPEGLVARIALSHQVDRDIGIAINEFGYRQDTPFGNMPKIRVEWYLKRLSVSNGGDEVVQHGVGVVESEKSIEVLIPWALLGYPETVFAEMNGRLGPIAISHGPWQVLEIKAGSHLLQ
ncbi:MAG: PIG-L family deacetylase [Candidatus Aureabacteria bacterium]|nr:PIG-L family deacetylase [Candidatus Auribacterota bacterium]